MKAYIKPAIQVFNVGTLEILANTGETNVNVNNEYGPGETTAKEWNGFDDQEDDGIYGYEKWDIKWSR